MWTLTFGHHEHRTRTHGYAATREAAMVAFAKSWRRERLSAIAAVLDYEEFVHWSKEASSLRYAFVYWSSPRKKLSCYWIFVLRPDLTRIMHYAALFCTSGELTRAEVPSGEIGVRQLVMQRVRG
jgi:hypothetical protein